MSKTILANFVGCPISRTVHLRVSYIMFEEMIETHFWSLNVMESISKHGPG
jgi:hypothetical protein